MNQTRRWWQGVTRYQWLVFLVVALAWGFDSLDQRIFSLARISALASLMHRPGASLEVQSFAKTATAVFLVGWGFGGIVFGALGDRLGRARILGMSILIYSLCTGLTAVSRSPTEFTALRFLTGLGIGGVYGLAVSTLAEAVEGRARVAMLAWLQILSLLANCAAAFIKMGIDALAGLGWLQASEGWRWLFTIGTVPALVGIVATFRLRESESWLKMKAEGRLPTGIVDAYAQLLADKAERRNLLIGSLLSISGVVGLWAIGEYAVDLLDAVFTAHFALRTPPQDVHRLVSNAKNLAYMLQMLGGACGMLAFTYLVNRIGRRPAFVIGFSAALIVTLFVYGKLQSPADAYWMMPLLGAAQLSVFAGFSIYLPELFATRVRGTGVSFAYNSGRFAAAAGSLGSALLTSRVFGAYPSTWPLRYSAMVMCSIFLVGIIAALFAPETRGKPLRE